MDVLQPTWWHLALVILINLLSLDISSVDCFTWHSIHQLRSHPPPPAPRKDVVQPAWQHSPDSKWYPYNLWKKRKRKETGTSEHFARVIPRFLRRSDKAGKLLSKYEKLLDKLHRGKSVNSILRNNKWKVEDASSVFGASYESPSASFDTPGASSTNNVLQDNGFTSHHSHFGNIASVQEDPFASMQPSEEPVTEEKKKVTQDVSGFDDGGFESFDGFDDGFSKSDDGFSKSDDGFSDGFVLDKSQNEADTSVQVHTGFDDGSFSDTGSWSDGGFGSDSGSWGNTGFSTMEGGFSDDTKDCDTILTKSCSNDSECQCHGFYTCNKQTCAPLQQDSSDASFGGSWGDEAVVFSKRQDPNKVLRIFMLPWKPQK